MPFTGWGRAAQWLSCAHSLERHGQLWSSKALSPWRLRPERPRTSLTNQELLDDLGPAEVTHTKMKGQSLDVKPCEPAWRGASCARSSGCQRGHASLGWSPGEPCSIKSSPLTSLASPSIDTDERTPEDWCSPHWVESHTLGVLIYCMVASSVLSSVWHYFLPNVFNVGIGWTPFAVQFHTRQYTMILGEAGPQAAGHRHLQRLPPLQPQQDLFSMSTFPIPGEAIPGQPDSLAMLRTPSYSNPKSSHSLSIDSMSSTVLLHGNGLENKIAFQILQTIHNLWSFLKWQGKVYKRFAEPFFVAVEDAHFVFFSDCPKYVPATLSKVKVLLTKWQVHLQVAMASAPAMGKKVIKTDLARRFSEICYFSHSCQEMQEIILSELNVDCNLASVDTALWNKYKTCVTNTVALSMSLASSSSLKLTPIASSGEGIDD